MNNYVIMNNSNDYAADGYTTSDLDKAIRVTKDDAIRLAAARNAYEKNIDEWYLPNYSRGWRAVKV